MPTAVRLFLPFALLALSVRELRREFPVLSTVESLIGTPLVSALLVLSAVLFLGLAPLARQVPLRYLRIGAVIVIALLIGVGPSFSSDVFLYLLQGSVFGLHGLNPYSVSPIEVVPAAEAVRAFYPWTTVPTVYGPLWVGISSLLAKLTAGNTEVGILALQLLAAVGVLATAEVASAVGRVAHSDSSPRDLCCGVTEEQDRESSSELYYSIAWNPFVLLEFVMNAHNDIWMVFFAVVGFSFYKHGQVRRGDIALLLGSSIKFIYLPLLLLSATSTSSSSSRGGRTLIVLLLLATTVLFAGTLTPLLFEAQPYPSFRPLWFTDDWITGRLLSLVVFCAILGWLLIARPQAQRDYLLFAIVLLIPGVLLPWYALWLLPACLGSAVRWRIVSMIGLASYGTYYSLSTAIFYAAPILVLGYLGLVFFRPEDPKTVTRTVVEHE